MKKVSVVALALFLLFAFGFQAYAEDLSVGATTRGDTVRNDIGRMGDADVNGFDNMAPRTDLGDTLDRTNMNNNRLDNQRGVRGNGIDRDRVGGLNNNNVRTAAATDNNGWGWLGILGLLGLAGMFGRNKNPQR